MQLATHDGIACDMCGMTCRNDFTYFSWDCRHVDVYENRRPSIDEIFRDHVIFSLDVCEQCFSKFRPRLIANYNKLMSNKRIQQVKLVCEWSGEFMEGTYEYYYVDVTKVMVRLSGQPFVCVGCGAKVMTEVESCKKCQSKAFVRQADVHTVQRFVELTISAAAYTELRDKAMEIRKVAGEWVAK